MSRTRPKSALPLSRTGVEVVVTRSPQKRQAFTKQLEDEWATVRRPRSTEPDNDLARKGRAAAWRRVRAAAKVTQKNQIQRKEREELKKEQKGKYVREQLWRGICYSPYKHLSDQSGQRLKLRSELLTKVHSTNARAVGLRETDTIPKMHWGSASQEDEKRNRLNGMSRHYVLQQTCEVLNNQGFYSRATQKKMRALRGIAPYSYGYCG